MARVLLASGRRTASSWFRAPQVGTDFRSDSYFLDPVGRKAHAVAAVVLKIVLREIDPGVRLVFALDDTPTKQYGPKVQGAGSHHNPTPGPAGSKLLYGQSWVTLSGVAQHPRSGVIGRPLLGLLYVQKKDLPGLAAEAGVAFQTNLRIAAEMLAWLRSELPRDSKPAWYAVVGGYPKREFLRPAVKAKFVVVARLRRDAASFGLPPSLQPGIKGGQGPTHDLWEESAESGQVGRPESGLAGIEGQSHHRPGAHQVLQDILAAGRVRDSYGEPQAERGSWRASLCTWYDAIVEAIGQTIQDRWAIEQNDHELEEVEGIEQLQLRGEWSKVEALNRACGFIGGSR